MLKEESKIAIDSEDVADSADPLVFEKGGTKFDARDLYRMGKLPQLRRNFQFSSIFGYSCVLGSTWEFALVVVSLSLLNGGPAGGIWLFLAVCFGMFFVVLSLAEMASMAPTSGGQYHWVSEFAPPKYQKFLSYIVGWFAVIGWQTAMCTASYSTAQQFEAIIALNQPGYVIKPWHSVLLTIAVVLFSIIWNTVLVRKLPLLEGIIMIIHVFGFVAVVVVLWVMAPRSPAKEVWTDIQDNAGWGNKGLACLVGFTGPVITLIGSDSACHLSEELKDAAWVLPRSMVATAVTNYILGFVMTVTIMSTLGDLDSILGTTTGQPYVQALLNATRSRAGTSILTSVVAVVLLFGTVNLVTTSSRQLFAFARDKGLPFSKFLAHVQPGRDIPFNAVMVTLLFTSLLCLIILGSTIAFNIIMSVNQVGILGSYIVAIACILRKRLCSEPLLPSRFNLGRAGIAINCIALGFLAMAFFFSFFPSAPHPNAASMNWSVLITGFTMSMSLVYYYFRGQYSYLGPVEYVKKLS